MVLLAAMSIRAAGARAAEPVPAPDLGVVPHEADAKSATAAVALELLFPGLGSLYADDPGGALVTWACVAGGFAALLIGASQLHVSGPDGPDPPATSPKTSPLALPLIIGGTAVALIGRLHGLQSAADATSRHNAALAPFVTPDAAGLTLGARF
ncbi:MAG TPA: hypothetical protein VIF57_08370 [Polyangia bacterium]